MIRLLLFIAALLAVPATAQSVSQQPHTNIRIIAESLKPAPGQPLTIGLVLTPKEGWHTYWSNPGDAGAPTRVQWTLPTGTPEPAALSYPMPETLIVSGLMNYVYSHANVLVTAIEPPAGLKKGTAFPVKVKADWLVCSLEQCVPESAVLTLPLVIGDGAADPENGYRVALAKAALPKPLSAVASWRADKGRLVIAVPFGDPEMVRSAYFFPDDDGVLDYVAPQAVTIAGDRLRIETKAAEGVKGPITGVLRVEFKGKDSPPLGLRITAQPGTVPAAGLSLAADRPIDAGPGLPLILLGAFVGGIILNIMPCVFPILSLKALSLANGNVAPAAARRDAIAYTLGVVLVCAALGGLVLALRAAGSQVGWAFQLQDPRVITGLLLLVTAIALNLAGVFEITLSTGTFGDNAVRKGGAMGSFATGALAAFVATPCTGPFMAGALGAALVLPPLAAIAVFAGLGLGLALPFLLIGFVPALRRMLPRPGAWMTRFRAILSIPMFVTALALAWVLGRQAGVAGMTAGLAGALAIGLLLWWLGSRQHGGKTSWIPATGAVLAGVAAVLLLPVEAPALATTTSAPAGLMAQVYSPEKLAGLRATKTPVFLYMTADWCLTCKVNEKGAMADPAVAAAFKRKGIAVLEGDWTRGDADISKWLAQQGRAGVPVYVFYAADGSQRELPQILTRDQLLAIG
jgi:DsbC/DsbD-like thiol-disulfide interchange protein/cytochrome c biogenesis protein CcdA